MSIVPGNSRVQIRDSRFEIRNSRGFTLLEIILAMAILGMMSLAIYRFVQSNLIAMRASSQASAAEAPYGGLRDLLTEQWQGLPQGRGGLSGEPFKLNDRQRDEIRWKCSAGSERESWVPLIKNVRSLQIGYFEPRLNSWVDRWTDSARLPRLVKLTIGRTDSSVPWEAIIPISRTPF